MTTVIEKQGEAWVNRLLGRMLQHFIHPFAKASRPRNKNHLVTRVPAWYIRQIFRLDQDGYQQNELGKTLLNDTLRKHLVTKQECNSWIFQPELDHRVALARPAADDDPLNINATGAIACTFYKDMWGRKGLALAIIVPSPFKREEANRNTVFVMNGYLDEEEDQFYVHDLYHAWFQYETKRIGGLSYEFMVQSTMAPRIFTFAEQVATALFEGQGDQIVHDIFSLWDKLNGIPATLVRNPWDNALPP